MIQGPCSESQLLLINSKLLVTINDLLKYYLISEIEPIYRKFPNSLLFKDTDFESLSPVLEGPSAIAISVDDATAPARVLSKFAKNAPALEIKAGVVEGTYYDADGMKAIASVPSREELLSKLLGSLQSPIANMARVLKQIAENGGAGEATEAPAEEAKAEEPKAEEAKVEEAPAEEAKAEEAAEEKEKAKDAE